MADARDNLVRWSCTTCHQHGPWAITPRLALRQGMAHACTGPGNVYVTRKPDGTVVPRYGASWTVAVHQS